MQSDFGVEMFFDDVENGKCSLIFEDPLYCNKDTNYLDENVNVVKEMRIL